MRRTLWPVLAFVGWTLFVWGVRIRNADGSVGAVLLSLTFVVPAVAVLVTRGALRRAVLRALVAWTVVVWAVRLLDIVWWSDRSVAFTVVHAALGVLSVGLGLWAVRPRTGSPSYS